jgi:hypothetical protein
MYFPALIVLLAVKLTDAFSSGAGGCEGGMAAVSGRHLDDSNDRPVGSGPLSEPGLMATIGGVILDPDETAELPIKEDLTIAIEGMQIPFKGTSSVACQIYDT